MPVRRPRGSVPELSITVEEEREYLRGTLEDDVIGDQALSCVYIRLCRRARAQRCR
jgi:uncharacterized protein YpuA (DUF1002 family)